MRFTVLGCSGTFPGPDSPCSGYLFESEGYRLLVDLGNGATGVMQRCIGLLDVDAVIVSHLHGDHYLDIVTYTYARRYNPAGRPPRLPVYGPRGVGEHVAGAFGRPVSSLLDEVFDFHTLTEDRLDLGPFSVDCARVNHPVETFALRIGAGSRSVAYSADTGVCDRLVELAGGSDLFLCEASYLDGEENPPDVHLTGGQAAEHASRAGVGRLLLTHLVPWGDPERTLAAAHDSFAGQIELARTQASLEI
ncbi:MAG TPA: MBL fold metallo-hydrolase [Mycobacteriales bacterium]|nr:MBL fold metallo-hydrolase [Mycobacteriales bacterium]